MMDRPVYGAVMERGEIVSIDGKTYRIKSLDRDGVLTKAMYGADAEAYSVGDMVFFFAFADGTGVIFCKAYTEPKEEEKQEIIPMVVSDTEPEAGKGIVWIKPNTEVIPVKETITYAWDSGSGINHVYKGTPVGNAQKYVYTVTLQLWNSSSKTVSGSFYINMTGNGKTYKFASKNSGSMSAKSTKNFTFVSEPLEDNYCADGQVTINLQKPIDLLWNRASSASSFSVEVTNEQQGTQTSYACDVKYVP